MKALLLIWDLNGVPGDIFAQLRSYIAQESWPRYAGKNGMVQKVWFSNEKDGEYGAFYLWESEECREAEIEATCRIKAMTGRSPRIHRWEVEAIQEGPHGAVDLKTIGMAWGESGRRQP